MKLPNVAHLCGEPLSFETRDGVSYERCASCHYEAPVPRRPPTKAEAEARRLTAKIRKDKTASSSSLCRGGCGRVPAGEYATYCADCRRGGQVENGKASGIARARTA